MDIHSIDLNLLVVFDALARLRNVTRAAEALGLSQPATSAALARLRQRFGDPLFVRAGMEMKPTPRAIELVDPVRLVVATVSNEILRLSAFEAANSSRTFTIVTPDIGEVALIPRIAADCAQRAPGVNLRSISMSRDQAGPALESGLADLALGYFPDLKRTGFFQQQLFGMRYVCIMSSHRAPKNGILGKREFLDAKHVVVRPEGRDHAFEQFLLRKRIKRRVAIEIAHFMSLLAILPRSELVATVPQDIADIIARHVDIRICTLPLESPTIAVQQIWHARFHKDGGSIWLRGVIQKLLQR